MSGRHGTVSAAQGLQHLTRPKPALLAGLLCHVLSSQGQCQLWPLRARVLEQEPERGNSAASKSARSVRAEEGSELRP